MIKVGKNILSSSNCLNKAKLNYLFSVASPKLILDFHN